MIFEMGQLATRITPNLGNHNRKIYQTMVWFSSVLWIFSVHRTELANTIPGYVLHYCHMKVQIVIEGAAVWAGDDWVATRTYLVDLYGSNDSIPINSPDHLHQWCSKHGE